LIDLDFLATTLPAADQSAYRQRLYYQQAMRELSGDQDQDKEKFRFRGGLKLCTVKQYPPSMCFDYGVVGIALLRADTERTLFRREELIERTFKALLRAAEDPTLHSKIKDLAQELVQNPPTFLPNFYKLGEALTGEAQADFITAIESRYFTNDYDFERFPRRLESVFHNRYSSEYEKVLHLVLGLSMLSKIETQEPLRQKKAIIPFTLSEIWKLEVLGKFRSILGFAFKTHSPEQAKLSLMTALKNYNEALLKNEAVVKAFEVDPETGKSFWDGLWAARYQRGTEDS
jgi:hypothetical protein